MTCDAPYPSNTKTKGWVFEVDFEKVQQSDTWALASDEARPWLLMMWATAWSLTPTGSLPGDESVLCARIGITKKQFEKHKAILMRGWTMANDGRLYHGTITTLVLQMLEKRKTEAERKAEYRKKKDDERKAETSHSRPQMSHGTDTVQTWESTRNPTLTTDHLPPLITKEETHSLALSQGRVSDFEKPNPTKAAECAMAMKRGGIGAVSPQHPELVAMANAGVTLEQFEQAAATAVSKSKGFAYALGILKGQLREANAIAADGLVMPEKPWDESRSSIDAEGIRLGLGAWDEGSFQLGRGEAFSAYKDRVVHARETKGVAA